jgi:hypothetical protein
MVGLLAASRRRGWRVSAWSAGAATTIAGVASIALPAAEGTLGQASGAVAVAWGVLVVAAAEREARQPIPQTGSVG